MITKRLTLVGAAASDKKDRFGRILSDKAVLANP